MWSGVFVSELQVEVDNWTHCCVETKHLTEKRTDHLLPLFQHFFFFCSKLTARVKLINLSLWSGWVVGGGGGG